MAKVAFNVDAYTARLIGRENVSKLNGAIIELVKNTYDADSSICILYYEDSSDTLYIIDNGCGMTKEIVVQHWMTIGRSTKKAKFISTNGRVQTGAKGIGRFALDRIADTCEMLTMTNSGRLLWKVNWEDFTKSSNITDVTAELDETEMDAEQFTKNITNVEVQKLIKDNLRITGTIFKMSLLRDNWNASIIGKIKDDLATLIPYEMREAFNIYFFDEQKTRKEAEVLNVADAFSYDYKIQFEVNEKGKVLISIIRNEFDFGDKFDEIMKAVDFTEEDKLLFKGKSIEIITSFSDMLPKQKGAFENKIGKFSGVLYFGKVTSTKVDAEKYYYKSMDRGENNRNVFGGIKIYRDSFRVRPYGEPNTSNYDWLLLAGRKNKSPAAPSHSTGAWRVNSDQIIGSIFISRLNLFLPDQSNREGIVETKEFMLLKEFIINVIREFESDRQYVFRKLNKYYEKRMEALLIQEEINRKVQEAERNINVADNKGNLPAINNVIDVAKAKTALDHKDNVIRELEDENRLLRTLATTGIVTNTYVHEIKDITHKLNMKIVMAKEALELDRDLEKGLEYIKQANIIRESLNSWFKVTIGAVTRDKRTMRRNNICNLITQVVSSWKDTLKDITIELDMENNDIELKCFPYDVESILSNLIANSVSSFDANIVDKKVIKIKVVEVENIVKIEYSDTGIGLSEAYRKNPRKILESMETDKRNEMGETIGTGMGMWIINRTVNDYSGSIDLAQNMREDSGFYMVVSLRKR